MPVVTATTPCSGLRPVAKALGCSCATMKIRGIGRPGVGQPVHQAIELRRLAARSPRWRRAWRAPGGRRRSTSGSSWRRPAPGPTGARWCRRAAARRGEEAHEACHQYECPDVVHRHFPGDAAKKKSERPSSHALAALDEGLALMRAARGRFGCLRLDRRVRWARVCDDPAGHPRGRATPLRRERKCSGAPSRPSDSLAAPRSWSAAIGSGHEGWPAPAPRSARRTVGWT